MRSRATIRLAGALAVACSAAMLATSPAPAAGRGETGHVVKAATGGTPRNGRIFFSTGFILPNPDLVGDEQVYSIRPDGSHLRPLTQVPHGAAAGDPSVSPDGTSVAYVDNRGGGFELWLMKTSGRDKRRLLGTSQTDYYLPSWAPSGKRLLVSACDTTLGFDSWCDLVSLRADGSHLRTIVAGHRTHESGQYSPNGRWIEFSSDRGGYVGAIWVVRAGGGTPRRVTPPRLEASGGTWSPDGRSIAFSDNCCQPHTNIWTVSRTGHHLTKLTDAAFGYDAGWPAYSPDGRLIAFTSNVLRAKDSAELDLFVMRADGTHQRRIESSKQPAVFSSWGRLPAPARSEEATR